MFSLGAFSGAAFIAADPEEARTPPASPTPVSFPQYDQHTTSPRPWSSDNPPPDLNYLFSHTTRHVDIKPLHLDVLNVSLSSKPYSAGDLIPRGVDDADFYPHWQVQSVTEEEPFKVGPNGRPIRPVLTTEERLRKDFIERLSELETDNDAAFRVLNKRNLPGVRPPRIATMRKFWAQLENLSHYWDISLDDYFQIMEAESDTETQQMNVDSQRDHSDEQPSPEVKSPKRPRVDGGPKAMLSGTAIEAQDANGNHDDNGDTIMTDNEPSVASDPNNTASSLTADPVQPTALREKRQYKGRRLGTGRDMPDRFRSDAIVAFVEGCAWPFNSTVVPPRRAPAVRFGNLNIPIKQIASVYRLPNDGARRRAGWIQGPLIGLQSRLEVEFSVEKRHDEDEAGAVSDNVLPSRPHPAIAARMRKEKSSSAAVSADSEKMDVDVVDSGATLDAGAADTFQKPGLPSSLSSSKARAVKKKPPPVVEPAARGRLDVLREIGLLLEIAQERYREGKTESRPGAGQWWTEKPRWGGGKGGPVGDADKPGDRSPSSPSAGADSPSGIDFTATATHPTAAVPRRSLMTSNAATRQASASSPTTLDFSSLRNKYGAGSATVVNGLGRTSSSSNKEPLPTSEAAKPVKVGANKSSTASSAPIHPSLPTTSSLPPPSLMRPPTSSSIDPILASASIPSASFANEMFARHQRRERKSPAEMWETLRCPTATWDAKTEYRAIGKDKVSTNSTSTHATAKKNGEEIIDANKTKDDMKNSAHAEGPNVAEVETSPSKTGSQVDQDKWDEVFIVSSLNHHISILRLSVHDAYLECILTGRLPSPSSAGPSATGLDSSEQISEGDGGEKRHWSVPRLRRSRWYDLLDPKDRCEAFRVLWGIMAYLCRDETIW